MATLQLNFLPRIESERFGSSSCPTFSNSTEVLSTNCCKRTCHPVKRRCVKATLEEWETQKNDVSGILNSAVGRRKVLSGAAALVAAISYSNDNALALTKAPKGFSSVLDNIDGYAFFYPFGWQEVSVKGQDVAYKDVIEPLESVSVSIVKTDKNSLDELGSPDEVARALVARVLSSPSQKTTVMDAKARVTDGKTYYQFEFIAEARNFTRHALSTVAVAGGKFFTITTGANERRWGKIEDKLRLVVESFTTL